ncbi:MAG: hypothetical protein INF16_12150 [Methylobacterium sp.]|nr:hypothetical protein [Methylobacterium sp.]MCA3645400.1 hypothetical protein [Methylobacterium sp.]MCA3651861.1 hypothetical protein [Methylobacterium sp.]MCA4922079.1 hypothetical protein [Methylobacterium sp.]
MTKEATPEPKPDEATKLELPTPRGRRTIEVIKAELLDANTTLERWQRAFDNYSGNNPNKFRSDIRSASERVRRLKMELSAAEK